MCTNDSRTVARDVLPATHARSRCVLDHVERVQTAMTAALGTAPAIDVPDGMLERL